MKHIFIVNPAAGTGNSEKVFLPQIISVLKAKGVDYEIHRSLNKAEIGTYTRQRAKLGDAVRFYAVGGDGTICDVLNGIVDYPNAELAAIPCGSGNDFVRNFTNKKNFLDIEKQINGTVVPLDAIKYNDYYAMNMLNIGADCDVVVRASEIKDSFKGALGYAVGALQILPKGPRYRMSYVLPDGTKKEEDLLLAAVANGHYCGGGFKSCPKASLTDGLLDIGLVRPVMGAKLMKLLLKYRSGTHLNDRDAAELITYFQVSEFDIEPCCDCVVSVDGEVFPFEKTHFECIPGAVNFVIPKDSELIK